MRSITLDLMRNEEIYIYICEIDLKGLCYDVLYNNQMTKVVTKKSTQKHPKVVKKVADESREYARGFCFTINNYSLEEYAHVKTWDCRYLIFGREMSKTGTPHLQGYIYFETQRTLSALKKKLNNRAHWEVARGTPEQASTYCKKEGDVFEKGTKPLTPAEKGQLIVNKWQDAFDCVKEGRIDEMEYDMRCNHLKKIEYAVQRTAASEVKLETLDGDMQHEWIYGPTGTGKSYTARTENPNAYIKMAKNKWWDDYNYQDTVIIEEVGLKATDYAEDFKIMLDRYKFRAEVKGGSMLVRPRKIIITSNYHPKDIWLTEQEINPIMRRLKIRHLYTKFALPSNNIESLTTSSACGPE